MFSLAGIVFVLGYLSGMNTQSTTTSLPTLCLENACYIRPDSNQRNWTDAQQKCKGYGSTLPIVSDPVQQSTFEAACRNLTILNEMYSGIWIGAKAFYGTPMTWTWLDGSTYNGPVVQSQGYQLGYAYVKEASAEVLAYASYPTNSWPYICYYPPPSTGSCANSTGQTAFYIESRCYVKYDENMSWFSARNNCLTNKGDLASFPQLSLLSGKIDSNGVWVGLRNNQWQLQNAVTGLSSDVTFTLWYPGQPNDETPSCISTDASYKFPGWRDWDCTRSLPFICQVNSTTWATPSTSSNTPNAGMFSLTSAPTDRDSNRPTPTNPSSSTTGKNSKGAHSVEHQRDDTSQDSVDLGLPVGLGVGIGVPVVIILIVVIIVIILRKKRQSSLADGNSKFKNKFLSKNGLTNTEPETTEMNEVEHGRTVSDNASAQYATIPGAMGLDQATKLPSSQSIEYASLSFNQANSWRKISHGWTPFMVQYFKGLL